MPKPLPLRQRILLRQGATLLWLLSTATVAALAINVLTGGDLPGSLARYDDRLAWLGLGYGALGLWTALRLDRRERRERESREEPIGVRANRYAKQLQSALRDVTSISDELQREADEARRTVERLREDTETYQQIKEVSQEEAEAVARLLRSEMRSGERRSFRSGLTVNALFFLAGVVVTVILARLGLA